MHGLPIDRSTREAKTSLALEKRPLEPLTVLGERILQKCISPDRLVTWIIQNRFSELGSWKAVAEELGLNRGLVYQVAHGQVTSSEKAKKAVMERYGRSQDTDQPRQLNLFYLKEKR